MDLISKTFSNPHKFCVLLFIAAVTISLVKSFPRGYVESRGGIRIRRQASTLIEDGNSTIISSPSIPESNKDFEKLQEKILDLQSKFIARQEESDKIAQHLQAHHESSLSKFRQSLDQLTRQIESVEKETKSEKENLSKIQLELLNQMEFDRRRSEDEWIANKKEMGQLKMEFFQFKKDQERIRDLERMRIEQTLSVQKEQLEKVKADILRLVRNVPTRTY